jgi:hypothetical protein
MLAVHGGQVAHASGPRCRKPIPGVNLDLGQWSERVGAAASRLMPM